jgi:hypothetical protein
MAAHLDSIPPWLLAPVACEHRPPVRTSARLLPFGELDPADFERLCVALAMEDGEPERCRLYGTPGQAQGGIDLYARLPSGRYATYQCKRYKKLVPSNIRAAVNAFRRGNWLNRSERFVFCTSWSAARTQLADEIEQQAVVLGTDGVELVVWDAEELSARLKTRPRIVLDFFGRAWVADFCTEPLPNSDRLDAAEIAALRAKLREFYGRLFARQDVLVDDGTPVTARFVEPDVLRVRHLDQRSGQRQSPEAVTSDPRGTGDRDERPPEALTGTADALVTERTGAIRWLETHRRTLLLGDAGSGKSTLMRWLCLELLADEPQTSGPGGREGAFVAVWLPFGRWVAAIADGDRELSLPELLQRFFGAYGADDLWRLVEAGLQDERLVLLVDGLDEWSDESAADVAADRLQQYLFHRSLPALACARPEGLRILRAIDPEWSTAELAPLSDNQQRQLLEGLGATPAAAGILQAAAHRAVRLRRLAGNPLLLGLMWRLHAAGIGLPADGQAVFAEFIRWLVRVQAPARRRIVEVADPLDLDHDEVEAALAALALAAQRSASPALSLVQARKAVVAFLRDDATIGLQPAEARTQARLLIDQARGPIGLLSQLDEGHLIFAHRALQEHLAGRALAIRSLAERAEILRGRAADPSWRNALDALVWMAPTSQEADALMAAISESPSGSQARWAVMPLLAQIALGPSRVTAPARAAAVEVACAFVASDDRRGPRGDTLDLLLAGLDVEPARPIVLRHLARWWPCREENRAGLLDAMHAWPEESATVELWWRAIADEHTATARKAGALLVQRFGGTPAAGDRLAAVLAKPIPAHSRASALEALSRGWPEHPDLDRLVSRALAAADPDLRLIALDDVVRREQHGDAELDLALELANGWIAVDYHRHDQLADVLVRGWPAHDRIRQTALATVDDERHGRPMEIQLATLLLVSAFGDHPEVRTWVARSLSRDHGLVLLGADGWRALGENMREDPELTDKLEGLFAGSNVALEVNLCQLALGLRTPRARAYVLGLLRRTEGFPSASWPFGTLVKGWPHDGEVVAELRAFARSGGPRVREVVHWIDDVLPESEATEMLLDLARDPANDRVTAALDALARREDPETRAQAFAAGWQRRAEVHGFGGHRVADVLLAGFGEQLDVLELARQELRSAEVDLRAVALAARHHASLREEVRRMAVPLPVELRRRLTQRLFEHDVDSALLAELWRLESDGMAAGAAASAAAVGVSPAGRAALVEEAVWALHARKLDHEGEGQAGLCALLELGEVERFAEQRFGHGDSAPLWIDIGVFRRNWWLASRVAAHFEEVRAALGDDLHKRFHDDHTGHRFWAALAPFALQNPPLREAVLSFMRKHGAQGNPELLRFLAAVRPRSRELADVLVTATTGDVVDRSMSRTSLLLGAELLAQHFAADDEVLERLIGSGRPSEGELLALALGWSGTPEARARFAEAHRRPFPLSRDVGVRLHLMLSEHDHALDVLCSWLREGEGQGRLGAPPTTVALRRTAGDVRFARALANRVRDGDRPSVVGSGARLLAAAGRVDAETRVAVEARCAKALSGPDTDLISLDMVSEELRPLGWVLSDALLGAPAAEAR